MRLSRLLTVLLTTTAFAFIIVLFYGLPVKAGYQEVATKVDASYKLSDDGRTLVYVNNLEEPDTVRQLYVLSVEHPHPIQLTFERGGVDPLIFQITPDGEYLVFVAFRRATNTDLMTYIRKVPIRGGASTTIAEVPGGLLQADTGYEKGLLSPDGRYVLYRTSSTDMPDGAFFSVPVAGGTPVRLDPPDAFGVRHILKISPDSRRVAFVFLKPLVIFEGNADGMPMYMVPITGGTAIVVDPLSNGIEDFDFTADGEVLVFRTPLEPDSITYRTYGIHTDGTGLSQIGADSFRGSYKIALVGSRIFYEQAYTQTVDGIHYELFTLPALGDTPVLLHRDSLSTTTTMRDQTENYLIFQQRQLTAPPFQENYLFSGPTDGSTALVRLTDDVGNEGGSSLITLGFTPDGRTMLYSPVAQTGNPKFLYAVPLDGSEAPRLLYPTQAVNRWLISADGSRVFAIIDKVDEQEVVEIGLTSSFTVPLFRTEPRPDTAIGLIPPAPPNNQLWLASHPGGNPNDQTLYLIDSTISSIHFPTGGVLVEERATPFTTSVTLSAASLTTVTAEIDVIGGTATAGEDYTFTPLTITFAPGEMLIPVPVTLLDDETEEGDETVILEISNVVGGGSGTTITQTITIAETVYRQWMPVASHNR